MTSAIPLFPPNPAALVTKISTTRISSKNGGAWNIYFGGWDGVSSCHDSVSITVTLDRFASFGPHESQIYTGNAIHVNNPSAIKINETTWLMVTTQLQGSLNKPSIAEATNGINWIPNSGGVPTAAITVNGYSEWDDADVNGGNVIFMADKLYHFYFIDFKNFQNVYHATSTRDLHNFEYAGVSLGGAYKVVNDFKYLNGLYIMALHMNGPNTYYSISNSPNGLFPQERLLFTHMDKADQYIVSCGFVVDEASQRLMGALYGAGPVPSLDENEIFGVWLQKRVLFENSNTVWGLGDASRAIGPDVVRIGTNQATLTGQFYLYAEDYVDVNHRGTLLEVSPTVTVQQGDIWKYSP